MMMGMLMGMLSWIPVASVAEEVAGGEAARGLSGVVTVGYDSRYVLYGFRLSRHLWHADVYLHYPVSERTSLWGGSWFGYLTDGTYREVDGYVGVDHAVNSWLTLGVAYSIFNYIEVPFEASRQAHEVAVHATVAEGPWSFSLRTHYDTDADGYLVRGIGGYYTSLTDRVGLDVGAEAGYSLRYFTPGTDWNHGLVAVKAPVAVGGGVVATPFVARSIPLSAIRDFEVYETVWGVSMSWGF